MKSYISLFFLLLVIFFPALAHADYSPNWDNDRLGTAGSVNSTNYPVRYDYVWNSFWTQPNNGYLYTQKNHIYLVGHLHHYENPAAGEPSCPTGYKSGCWNAVYNFEQAKIADMFNRPAGCNPGAYGQQYNGCLNSRGYWIVANEPSNQGDNKLDANNATAGQVYADMFIAYRDYIRSFDPWAHVGTGGIDPFTMKDPNQINAFQNGFRNEMLTRGAAMPDFWSIHSYPFQYDVNSLVRFDGASAHYDVMRFRNWMGSVGDNHPLWLKETGLLDGAATQAETTTFMDRATAVLLGNNLVQQIFWFYGNGCENDGFLLVTRLQNCGSVTDTGTHWQQNAQNILPAGQSYTRGNYVKNPGFEAGDTRNWVQDCNGPAGCSFDVGTSFVPFNMFYAGAFAKGASSNYARLYQDMTTTNGNHNYYVGAWVKSGVSSGTVEVCLNDVARQATISCQTKTVGGNWIRFAFQTKTPSSTIPGNPNGALTTRISIKALTTTGGYFFTDDAVVVDRTECGDTCQPNPWN